MEQLKLSGITKRYQGTTVLHDINLDIQAGEFLVLVGPSGCGKSTLLKMIAGLEDITEGEIRAGHRLFNRLPPQQRNIAMVFQSYALYPHLSIYENIAFGMKVRKEPAASFQKVEKAAAMLNLTDYLERLPGQLSGGQRQRVAMGRALVRDADFFLFDEPLSNLDAKLRVQMRGEIKALHNQQKKTTIYVTHDQVEAMTLADRVVIMNRGRIEQTGKPLDLYDQPDTMFVAGFLGSPSISFIPAVTSRNGVTITSCEDGQPVHLPLKVEADQGKDVMLGVRPEGFVIGKGNLPFVVNYVELMGAESNIYGTLSGYPCTIARFERVSLQPGRSSGSGWITARFTRLTKTAKSG